MTTEVRVKPHNFPVKITTRDKHGTVQVEYLKAGEEKTYYCTTTRTIEAVDVEYSEVPGAGVEPQKPTPANPVGG